MAQLHTRKLLAAGAAAVTALWLVRAVYGSDCAAQKWQPPVSIPLSPPSFSCSCDPQPSDGLRSLYADALTRAAGTVLRYHQEELAEVPLPQSRGSLSQYNRTGARLAEYDAAVAALSPPADVAASLRLDQRRAVLGQDLAAAYAGVVAASDADLPNEPARRGRAALYTCITGGYEKRPRTNASLWKGLDAYAYVDDDMTARRARRDGWKVVRLPPHADKHLQQRLVKAIPPKELQKYAVTAWIDGGTELREPAISLLTKDYIPQVTTTRHPQRTSVYAEIAEVVKLRFTSPEAAAAVTTEMKAASFPDQSGLSDTRFVVRKSSPAVSAFNQEWASLIRKCKRDQASFDFLVWKHNLTLHRIWDHRRSFMDCTWWRNHPHGKPRPLHGAAAVPPRK